MIGNDIIDLKLAGQQSNWRRRGFLEKVFTTSEIKLLQNSRDVDQIVWLLWSMKEAAYKAHQRKNCLNRSLNWKVQQCLNFDMEGASATGIVKIGQSRYFTQSNISTLHIHTVAADKKLLRFRSRLYQLPGEQSKQLLIKEVSELFDTRAKDLAIRKTEEGIPYLYNKFWALPLSFSFSDHGRFSGFSFALIDS